MIRWELLAKAAAVCVGVAQAASAQTWQSLTDGSVGAYVCPSPPTDHGHFYCITIGCPRPGAPLVLEVYNGEGGEFSETPNPVRLLVDGSGWDILVTRIPGGDWGRAAASLPPEAAGEILARLRGGAMLTFSEPPPSRTSFDIPLAGTDVLLAPAAAQCGVVAASPPSDTGQAAAQGLLPVHVGPLAWPIPDPAVRTLVEEAHGATFADIRTYHAGTDILAAAAAFDLGQGKMLLFTHICAGTYFGARGCAFIPTTLENGRWQVVFDDRDLVGNGDIAVDLDMMREGWPDIVIDGYGVRWVRHAGAYEIRR